MSPHTTARRGRVVIVQPLLLEYRVTFYELLRDRLDAAGIRLEIVHGAPPHGTEREWQTRDLGWTTRVDERIVPVGSFHLAWQPCLDEVAGADLVIVEQATKRLVNYVLLGRQVRGGPRVAFWGHGRNFQATSRVEATAEVLKRFVTRRAHWFFAYNDLSARVLHELGFPEDRTTVVGNSIDTRKLAAARDAVTDAETEALRSELGLTGTHVGIYCGTMYPQKRLPFLVDAARSIRDRVEDFELVFVGDGVDRGVVERAAREHDWIRVVGPKFGDELARHFALAKVHLLPGLVGLAVLDSFVLEVPVVTTASALHSPEIDYLRDGENGVMVPGDGSGGAYVDAVVDVLTDDALRARLVAGCRRDAARYSAEAMADRFADGVVAALKAPSRDLARLGDRRRRLHRDAARTV